MENDSVRSSGEFTVVDMWVEGKLRSVSVSREAIESVLRPDHAAVMTDDDRRDFVRNHLGPVLEAAKRRLGATDPFADNVVIEQLGSGGNERTGERRQGGDRRKGERRKANRPVAVERRKGTNRRKS